MRAVLSLVFLVAVLWASCTVKLGALTLAEHVDRIGETEQAQELLDGTRGRISPVLEDMKQRIFGEYVEAPTRAPGDRPRPSPGARPTRGTAARPSQAPSQASEAAKRDIAPGRAPSSAKAARLPGTGYKTPRDSDSR